MPVGAEIPNYRFVRRLDRQGAAPLYLAEQIGLERYAAVRIVDAADDPAESGLVQQFERERQALAHVEQPNVVRVYEIGTAGTRHFCAMEYLEGPTLAEIMGTEVLPARRAVDIWLQIAKGMAAIGLAGVHPQRLYPHRIVLKDGATPVLTDLAVFGTGASARPQTSDTKSGARFWYASPEQRTGQASDGHSDVFMLGCLLLDLLTGKPPPPGCRDAVPDGASLDAMLRALPAGVQDVGPAVRRMLAAEPGDRYAGVAVAVADLAGIETSGFRVAPEDFSRPPATPRRRSRMRLIAPGSLLILLGAGFTAWQMSSPRVGEAELVLLRQELVDFTTYMSRMDIYGPPGANATESLQRILAVSREHPDVVEAAELLAAIYHDDARASFRRGDLDDAFRLASRGLEFAPDNSALLQFLSETGTAMQQRQVAQLLRKAGEALQAQNQLPPHDGNAYSLLLEVKRLDPGNRSAETALREIQLNIAEQARQTWSSAGVDEARGLALGGLDLFPESPLLLDLLADLDHEKAQAGPGSANRP